MTIAKKVEEYGECFFDECAFTKKLSPEQCQYAIEYFSKFLEASLREHGESEYKRGMEDGELEILRERQREGLKHIDELLKS